MAKLDPRRLLAQALLPRYATGALPRPLRALVRRHLESDAELAAVYQALRRAERAAAHGAELSAGQLDLIEANLLDAIERQPAHTSAHMGRVPRSWGAAWAGAAWSGALAAGALGILFVLARPAGHDASPFGVGDLAARAAALQEHPLGVSVACVLGDVVIDSASAGARDSGDTLRCAKGGLLAFSTTNLAGEVRHVFVVGIAKDGARRWYAPFDKGASSVAVPAGQVGQLLPTLADTSALPDDDVTLFVLLSDQPFTGADVERQLAASERRGVPLGHLERLPVGVPLQGRIDVVRGPR